jgi:hypothetical protein
MSSDDIAELQRQLEALRIEMGILRETVADLQGSAIRWRGLYENAVRRCETLERELKSLTNTTN